MGKFGKIIFHFFLIVALVSAVYYGEILGFLASSHDGLLITIAKFIGNYFRHSTAWNSIFLILFINVSLVAFILTDIGVQKLLHKIFASKTRVSKVINHWLFNLTALKMLSASLCLFFFIILCNIVIIVFSNAKSVNEPAQISEPSPVLVLGTGKMLKNGRGENLYYTHRITAARDLWNAGKAEYFIVSGDRSGEEYDETRDIRNDLLAAGIPEEMIKIDTAGFRTLDSMLRIRGMFSIRRIIVVSQKFHVQRAVVLGMFYGMRTTGYYAKGSSTYQMIIRETFGKCKVVLDLLLFNMMPKVLLNDNKLMEYRKEFEVTTDLHVVLLLLITVSSISTLGLVIKTLD